MSESVPPASGLRWTVWQVIGHSLLIFLVFNVVYSCFAVPVAFLSAHAVGGGAANGMSQMFSGDALTMGIASIGATVLSVPFIKRTTARREQAPWAFLLVRPSSFKTILAWCLALLVLVAATDLITVATGRPVVAPWMTDLYATGNTAVLFVAIVLAAPVFEELVIRGFLIGGLEASGVSAVVAAVSSALAWSALHLQYDLYGIATIVPMGLLLALARHRTRSLLPCIAMHGLGNVVAFVEVVVASR